ncbi:MAG: flagellar biosynthesis regulator FlaF [Pseudomonadota bacterium]
MNASTMALRGYAENATSIRSDRRGEYEVFAQVTQRLRAAAVSAKTDFPRYVDALHDNRRLWTALAVEVADQKNDLPDDLRARIFYLAEFTIQQTTKVLSEKASVMPLLEINVAVMRGLKANGGPA